MSIIEKMLRRYLGGMGGHYGRSRHGKDYYGRDDDDGYRGDYREKSFGRGGAGLNCPQCRASNSPDARFCAQCGTALAVKCSQCGAALPAGAKFCASCGRAVGSL